MLGMHMGRVPAPSAREESGEIHRLDTYDWLQMINRASSVSNVEEGLLEKPLARRILTALNTLRDKAAKPNAVRPGLYITFEPEVLKLVGMEASVLHVVLSGYSCHSKCWPQYCSAYAFARCDS